MTYEGFWMTVKEKCVLKIDTGVGTFSKLNTSGGAGGGGGGAHLPARFTKYLQINKIKLQPTVYFAFILHCYVFSRLLTHYYQDYESYFQTHYANYQITPPFL